MATSKRLNLAGYIRVFLAYSFLIIEPILRILFAILPLRILADFARSRVAAVFGPPLKDPNSPSNEKEITESKFLTLHSTEDFLNYWFVDIGDNELMPHLVGGFLLKLTMLPLKMDTFFHFIVFLARGLSTQM